MPKIAYNDKQLAPYKLRIVKLAEQIINEYKAQGYTLTLRGVYYKFVARDAFPEDWKRITVGNKLVYSAEGSTNNQQSYDKFGEILADARMAGLLDWNTLVDSTRELSQNNHWDSPGAILSAVGKQYQRDKWEGQEYRPEVWMEKDAVESVVSVVCRRLDIPYFSCRGYTSLTSIWDAAQRLQEVAEDGVKPVVLHVGDHDPSGIDMSRDVEERLRLFMGEEHGEALIFERLALNMDQVRRYKPPENPTKPSDGRSKGYIKKFGKKCWELDALEPSVISDLIEAAVAKYRDEDLFEAAAIRETAERGKLAKCASKWETVSKFLDKK